MIKNFKFQISNFKLNNKGFTLIELLAVMIILLSIGSIIGAILFASLRGTTKTNTLTSVRQNGNFALTLMTKMIRDARRLDGVSTDGINYVTTCSNSATSYRYIKITSFDEGQTTFSCLAGDTIASQSAAMLPVSLLDKTVVSLTSCSITCTQTGKEPPTIGIQFVLSQYAPTGTIVLPEKTATIPFQTSVTLRNVGR